MTKTELQTRELQRRIETRLGVDIDWEDANALRRAEITLGRWAELECGTGNDRVTVYVERDEETGKCYKVVDNGHATHRYATPDRETATLKRVKTICERYGLHYFHQGDPRV